MTKHLVPGIGAHRLARLQPEHLERLYARMIAKGSAPATVHQAHRTVRTALNEAVRRGYLAANPARIAKAPRLPQGEIQPYTVDEVKKLIAEAENGRNSVRWVIALSLGLRQGEALGLQWSDVDLEKGALTVRRALQRPRWRHGCGGTCGKKMRRARRAVIGIMGWSDGSMAMRYQHLTAEIHKDIAKRVGGLLWAVKGGRPRVD